MSGEAAAAAPIESLVTGVAQLSVSTEDEIIYVNYKDETQLHWISALMEADLSEPYSDFTYRYFLNQWPQYSFLAMRQGECVGAIVCRLDYHRTSGALRGYIAMLAVHKDHRKRGIGSVLVRKAIDAMAANDCEEVSLETEVSNKRALSFYENLGFIRDKRLEKYYLNGGDAYRLKMWLR